MRYYQSIVDISILSPGEEYNKLRKSFIIFICNYDPFERERYIYTFENICREEPDLKFGDETYKIVINTKGSRGEISKELKEIIVYLDEERVTGEYSRELDEAVKAVKSNEERRLEYMMLFVRDNEMRAEGRAEGIKEGIKEGLRKGEILQTIKLYRQLLHSDDEQIKAVIMKDFNISEEEAEKYMTETVPA